MTASNEDLQKLLEGALKVILELKTSLDVLVNAAKEGGGIVPKVDYVKMAKWRRKYGKKLKIKCKKDCIQGPCRYGPKQALRCFEMFEHAKEKRKKRKLIAEHIPYTAKQLGEFPRPALMVLCSEVGVNLRKVFRKGKGRGNEPLIEAILKHQPKYVKWREKHLKKKQAKIKEAQDREDRLAGAKDE